MLTEQKNTWLWEGGRGGGSVQSLSTYTVLFGPLNLESNRTKHFGFWTI